MSSPVGLSSVTLRAETLSASAIRPAMAWFSSPYASVARPSLPIAKAQTGAASGVPSTALNSELR